MMNVSSSSSVLRAAPVDQPETLDVYLSEHSTPVAFARKLSELIAQGISEPEAREFLKSPIELELVYEPEHGLFALESEAISSSLNIISPYSGVPVVGAEAKLPQADRMSRYTKLRNELLSELRFLLSAMKVNFVDVNDDDYEIDDLYDLPCLTWINKHGSASTYHITDLRLDESGEVEAIGIDDESGHTQSFDEGHLDIYHLAYWLDRILAGEFKKVD